MAASLWEVFAASVDRFGDRVAVEVQRSDRVDAFTYRDLHGMARAAEAWLAGWGVAPGERCALLADNGAEWCGAFLGILARGATAVPLDTNYSAAQIATILRDSGARVLLANERLMEVAREALSGAGIACDVVPVASAIRRPHEGAPPAAPREGASAPAVILYTSGTTSDPKGVVLSHANLIAERDAAFTVVTVTEQDAVLGVLPLFHALALLANLLLPFAVGARVVYLETVNSTELLRGLAERGITLFACVPQFFYLIHQRVTDDVRKAGSAARLSFGVLLGTCFRARRLGINLGRLAFARVHRRMGGRIRLFITGGSKFDPVVGRDLYAMGFSIVQAYGLTETSGAATIGSPADACLDTVGPPLPGTEVAIVDAETGERRLDGDEGGEGEIAVRGPIVMQGYHNRPDATAAVMKDGWFLTGDLGRIDARGRVTITGRKKEVIVLSSGKNIYPEEIEAHYRRSAFVKEICVLGLAAAGQPTSERLHAVVVPDTELLRERKMVNAGDILRFEMEGQAAALPPHKRVLGYDVWFDPLPRTTTGKVKRHEVERLVKARHAQSRGDAPAALAPADEAWLRDPHVDGAMALVRARTRSGARVVPDANLELDLGLDSMERVELLTELEQRFGVRVSTERAHEIFTVRHAVEAVRPRATEMPHGSSDAGRGFGSADSRAERGQTDESWAALLRDLPPASDPVLGGLLERKWISLPVLFVASRVARLLIGRPRVTGLDRLPREGAFIISPNHQSYLDPVVVCAVLPFRVFRHLFFVGAVEYFETPLTRWVARVVNCVPVDPDSNLVPAMKAGAFGLSRGKVLMLFPEGERSIDGTVRRFKKGAPILARHLGVPIVPVALKGVHEIWPRNRPLAWRRLGPWNGHRATVAFGEPMWFGDDESYADAAHRLRERVAGMWERA